MKLDNLKISFLLNKYFLNILFVTTCISSIIILSSQVSIQLFNWNFELPVNDSVQLVTDCTLDWTTTSTNSEAINSHGQRYI